MGPRLGPEKTKKTSACLPRSHSSAKPTTTPDREVMLLTPSGSQEPSYSPCAGDYARARAPCQGWKGGEGVNRGHKVPDWNEGKIKPASRAQTEHSTRPWDKSGQGARIFPKKFLLKQAHKKCLPSFPNRAKNIPHAEVVELVDTLS